MAMASKCNLRNHYEAPNHRPPGRSAHRSHAGVRSGLCRSARPPRKPPLGIVRQREPWTGRGTRAAAGAAAPRPQRRAAPGAAPRSRAYAPARTPGEQRRCWSAQLPRNDAPRYVRATTAHGASRDARTIAAARQLSLRAVTTPRYYAPHAYGYGYYAPRYYGVRTRSGRASRSASASSPATRCRTATRIRYPVPVYGYAHAARSGRRPDSTLRRHHVRDDAVRSGRLRGRHLRRSRQRLRRHAAADDAHRRHAPASRSWRRATRRSSFDVNVQPGQMIPYRGDLQR